MEKNVCSWSMTGMQALCHCNYFTFFHKLIYFYIYLYSLCLELVKRTSDHFMSSDSFRLLAAKYRPHGVYADARSVLVIHNLAHQV